MDTDFLTLAFEQFLETHRPNVVPVATTQRPPEWYKIIRSHKVFLVRAYRRVTSSQSSQSSQSSDSATLV